MKPRNGVTEKDYRQSRNAAKSTGPKSRAGKARSSRNAFRHGLASGTYISALNEPGLQQAAERVAKSLGLEPADDAVQIIVKTSSELAKIRQIRALIMSGASFDDAGSIAEMLSAIHSMERYERRALSRRKRAFKSVIWPQP